MTYRDPQLLKQKGYDRQGLKAVDDQSNRRNAGLPEARLGDVFAGDGRELDGGFWVPVGLRVEDRRGEPGVAYDGWEEALWRPGPKLTGSALAEFMQLAGEPIPGSAPGEAVLRFAGRWGALSLQPDREGPGAPTQARPGTAWGLMGSPARAPYWEPLAAWHAQATAMSATLELAATLRGGGKAEAALPTAKLMLRLACWTPWLDRQGMVAVAGGGFSYGPGDVLALPADEVARWQLTELRQVLQQVIRLWLRWGGCYPVPAPVAEAPEKGLRLVLRGRDLTGSLALDLANSVTNPMGLYVCDRCHYRYAPVERRPKTGQHHYCPACRAKRDWTVSDRARRRTLNAERRLAAQEPPE